MIENKYTNVKIEKETYLKIKNMSKNEGVSMVVLFAAIADFFTKNKISVFENLSLNFIEIEKINNLKYDGIMRKLTAIETAYLRPMLLKSNAINDVVFNNSEETTQSIPSSTLGISLSDKEKLREYIFAEWLNKSAFIKRPNINDKTKTDYQRVYSEEQIEEYIRKINELLG